LRRHLLRAAVDQDDADARTDGREQVWLALARSAPIHLDDLDGVLFRAGRGDLALV